VPDSLLVPGYIVAAPTSAVVPVVVALAVAHVVLATEFILQSDVDPVSIS